MSEQTSIERVVGNLDARVTMIESSMASRDARMDKRLDRMETSLEEVHEAVTSARGAWRAIAWVAGIAGTLAAAVTAIMHWLLPRP